MTTVLDDELDEADKDTEWLHNHYNELVEKYDQQHIAIKNKDVIEKDKELDGLILKLKQKGVEPADVLIQFIRNKRNEI
jgi:Family of unknown function (DUF5678)